MLVLPSGPDWAEAAVLYGGVLLVWALALYVASRAEPRRVSVLAALSMVALSVYLYGQALGGFAADLSIWATWLARTWAGAALAPGLWLMLTLALGAEEGTQRVRAWAARQYWPLAAAVPGVRGVEKLLVRKAGLEYLVDIHIEVDPELTVREGHAIGHAVKDRLVGAIVTVKDVLVHVEPAPAAQRVAGSPAGAGTRAHGR